LHTGDEAAADGLWRVFAGVSEAQRLFRAQTDSGDETQHREPDIVRRERGGDGRGAVQQQVELVDGFAAEPVGELALRQGADEQAEQCGAADQSDLRGGREAAARHVGDERAKDDVVGDVEEVTGGDEDEDPVVNRAHPGIVHGRADEALDGLRHYRVYSPWCRFAALGEESHAGCDASIGSPGWRVAVFAQGDRSEMTPGRQCPTPPRQ
jgi:hypothetical protein